MGHDVYANNMLISAKCADGKSVAAFPDPCMTPPPPPGVPVPYPNTSFSSDLTEGSKTVKIGRTEVALKNKSYYKTSTGNEAGCAPKKGVATSVIKGKTYFTSWSMNVKIEGLNVVRHMDLSTHNHGSMPGNTPTWPYLDKQTVASGGGDCKEDVKAEKDACKDYKPNKKDGKDVCDDLKPFDAKPGGRSEAETLGDRAAASDCTAARRCALQPYESTKAKCCHPQTAHHLIEASAIIEGRNAKAADQLFVATGPGKKYSAAMAPCVCAEGTSHALGGTHELMHTHQSAVAMKCPVDNIPMVDSAGKSAGTLSHRMTTYKDAKASAIEAMHKTFPERKCDPKCIEKQLDNYHNQCGIKDGTKLKAVTTTKKPNVSAAEKVAIDRSARAKASKVSNLAAKSTD